MAAQGLSRVGCDRVGLGVEVELQVEIARGDFSLDLREAVHAGVFGQELGDCASGGLGVGGRIWVAEQAG